MLSQEASHLFYCIKKSIKLVVGICNVQNIMKAPTAPKMHNLIKYKREFVPNAKPRYVKVETVVENKPYAICRGEKLKRESSLPYFEFYKIEKVK